MSGWYEFGGARLSYRDAGSGRPIVFLHPTPLNGAFWQPLLDELDELEGVGVRAIVPDLRGHGLSELGAALPVGGFSRVPTAPVLTMEQLASDVIALLDHLQIQDAAFAGCSIGGYVLLELWRRIPERMVALAFVCSKPQADAEAVLQKRAANIAQIQAGGTAALFDGMARSLIGATARARRSEILDELRAHMTLTPETAIAVQAGLALRPDSVATVGTITVPVLAIAGGEDPACTPAEVEAFRAAPGGCSYHLLPDAGHFAAYEQPGKVAGLLAGWAPCGAVRRGGPLARQ